MRYAAAVLALAARARADWSVGVDGIDFKNNDLTSFIDATNSSTKCYAACASRADCAMWIFMPAGAGCGGANATCWLKSTVGAPVAAACRLAGFTAAALAPQAFWTPPVGAVAAAGWLADELRVQATGLTGFLADFWPDIANSSFVGGHADGGLHERTPYWLNGVVPLSYQTQNAHLVAQRVAYLSYIRDHQDASGWIGLDDMPTDGNQYWSRINVVLALIQDFEGSGNASSITTIFNYLGEANRRLASVPLGGWATVRAQDMIMGVQWLIDNFDALPGVPAGFSQAWLVILAYTIHGQMLSGGGDWRSYFDTAAFPTGPACVGAARCDMLTHGVNIGQALKSEAVWWRFSGDLDDVASTYIRIDKLDKYHGAPSGMYMADEHLAGAVPSHGTETCAIVEAVVSYAQAAAIIGDAALFERAERVTYNALPAATTKDSWERVYLQAPNEANATTQNPHIWFTDGADGGTYSLEGNYGCCTANMHAGWPKFLQRAVGWASASGAVAVTMWAPLNATTPRGTVVVATDYPFGDTATVTVTPSDGAALPVLLRVPSWATRATLSVDGGAPVALAGSNGTFYPTATRAGGGASTFVVDFAPEVRLEPAYNGSVAVYRGALLYAAWIGQTISVTGTHPYNSKDLSVLAALPWNLALVIADASNPGASLAFARSALTNVPYNSTAVPVTLSGKARVVAGWGAARNAPAPPPASPACAAPGACGDEVDVVLVPFGSTHVRMSVLPLA